MESLTRKRTSEGHGTQRRPRHSLTDFSGSVEDDPFVSPDPEGTTPGRGWERELPNPPPGTSRLYREELVR